MNNNLLLLFKTNDFLRTIDNKLGSPVNTFEITVIFNNSNVFYPDFSIVFKLQFQFILQILF